MGDTPAGSTRIRERRPTASEAASQDFQEQQQQQHTDAASSLQPDVSIDRFGLIKTAKCGRDCCHDSIAIMNLTIAGFSFNAELLFNGDLRLPRGVSVPPALRQRAKEAARERALAEIVETWMIRQREPGEP